MKNNGGPQFYFSLFRLLTLFRGGNTGRTEGNGFEAWLVGLMVYSIHYLFFAVLFVRPQLEPWLTALLLVAVAFWVWIFWLFFLYLNSVIIKFLNLCGIFRTLPVRRAQSILWVTATTAMAFVLLRSNPTLREFGAVWLVAVAMNLVSALVLTFSDAARSPGK
jgi:hypothetical protein